jgi:hypothetical protein
MKLRNYPHLFLKNILKTNDGEKIASSTNVAGITGYLKAETETGSIFVTLYKYLLKAD